MESDEECERARLVPTTEDKDETEMTPLALPLNSGSGAVRHIMTTPPSPVSNKMSSSGAASLSSKTANKLFMPAPITPVYGNSVSGASSSRYLNVNPKLGNLSRRPSLLSDSTSRSAKDANLEARMTNLKRDTVLKIEPDAGTVPAPPNTPDQGSRSTPSSTAVVLEARQQSSDCSQLTTEALASDTETIHEEKGSNETLKSPSVAGTLGDGLSYLRTTRMGHTGLRSVGSSAFLKSLWGHRSQQRNAQHHSFFTDTTDVRQMEHSLLQLLEDFHSGKLRAFAKDGSMEQMQEIREQQERLARLHFDLGARQELYAPLSEEGLRANQENMRQLMSSLQQLSQSIEKLQLFNKESGE